MKKPTDGISASAVENYVPRRRRITPKMIVDPAWKDSDEGSEYFRIQRMQVREQCVTNHDAFEDYYPEEYGKKLPEEGAWIIILMNVRVGKSTGSHNQNNVEHITVPHLSVWFALPGQASITHYHHRYPAQAIIQTPQGEVRIWPHEYNIVHDIGPYLSASPEEGVEIRFMNESNAFDEERLFYIMARGIPRGEAQKMLLPELRDPFFCYFLMHEAYSSFFGEGCGMSRLLDVNHSKRRQSKRRMRRESPEVEVMTAAELKQFRERQLVPVDLDELLPINTGEQDGSEE